MLVTPLLFFKLLFVPGIVGGIGWAGKRWNAQIAGLLSGLPVVAGPISWFLYLQYGADFAVAAAQSTLLGISSLAGFCWMYAWASQRWTWWWSLAAGWGVFLLLALGLVQLPLSLGVTLVVTLSSTLLFWYLTPQGHILPAKIQAQSSELVYRMIFALVLVLLITTFAKPLGTRLSGVFSAFPVASSVLAVFTHRYHPKEQVIVSMRGALLGSLGLTTFYVLLAFLPRYVSFDHAFVAAIVLVLLTQGLLMQVRRARV